MLIFKSSNLVITNLANFNLFLTKEILSLN